MCTTPRRERTKPVRLQTTCRVFLHDTKKPIFLSEPSYGAVADARVKLHNLDATALENYPPTLIDAVTTDARPIQIAIDDIKTVLGGRDTEKLDAEREALRALETPDLDLDPTRIVLYLRDTQAELTVDLPIGVGNAPDSIDLVKIDFAEGEPDFVNPAFEGNAERLIEAIRMIAVEEQRHQDAQRQIVTPQPTVENAPE